MKKQWLLALASVVAVAACTKTPNPIMDVEVDDPSEAPAAIRFSTNVHYVETKAGVDEWDGQDLYIYGFEAGADGSFDYSTAYIDNVKAPAPAASGDAENPTLQGAINVYNANARDINGNIIPNTYYYYKDGTPENASNGVRDFLYNFYGYYVDNAAGATPTPAKSEDAVTLDITINGTQDVMLATTDKEADVVGKTRKDGDPLTTERLYSAYSARRTVVPNLVFKHQLSRFVFNVKAGNDKGKLVMIESINVKSLTQGTLTIAPDQLLTPAEGTTYADDATYLELKQADGSSLPALQGTEGNYSLPDNAIIPGVNVIPGTVDAAHDGFKRVGESLMVMPGEAQYTLQLNVIQFKLTDPTGENIASNRTAMQRFEQLHVIDLSETDYNNLAGLTNGQAAPGYQYTIDLTVYGPEEILINVTLTPWTEYGSHIGIDPDED